MTAIQTTAHTGIPVFLVRKYNKKGAGGVTAVTGQGGTIDYDLRQEADHALSLNAPAIAPGNSRALANFVTQEAGKMNSNGRFVERFIVAEPVGFTKEQGIALVRDFMEGVSCGVCPIWAARHDELIAFPDETMADLKLRKIAEAEEKRRRIAIEGIDPTETNVSGQPHWHLNMMDWDPRTRRKVHGFSNDGGGEKSSSRLRQLWGDYENKHLVMNGFEPLNWGKHADPAARKPSVKGIAAEKKREAFRKAHPGEPLPANLARRSKTISQRKTRVNGINVLTTTDTSVARSIAEKDATIAELQTLVAKSQKLVDFERAKGGAGVLNEVQNRVGIETELVVVRQDKVALEHKLAVAELELAAAKAEALHRANERDLAIKARDENDAELTVAKGKIADLGAQLFRHEERTKAVIATINKDHGIEVDKLTRKVTNLTSENGHLRVEIDHLNGAIVNLVTNDPKLIDQVTKSAIAAGISKAKVDRLMTPIKKTKVTSLSGGPGERGRNSGGASGGKDPVERQGRGQKERDHDD
jgi:hypothetical protein